MLKLYEYLPRIDVTNNIEALIRRIIHSCYVDSKRREGKRGKTLYILSLSTVYAHLEGEDLQLIDIIGKIYNSKTPFIKGVESALGRSLSKLECKLLIDESRLSAFDDTLDENYNSEDVEDEILRMDWRDVIDVVLANLDEIKRLVITYRYLDDLSAKEIAEELDYSEQQINNIRRAALSQLERFYHELP